MRDCEPSPMQVKYSEDIGVIKSAVFLVPEYARTPNGSPGQGVNGTNWHWHLVPGSVAFDDVDARLERSRQRVVTRLA